MQTNEMKKKKRESEDVYRIASQPFQQRTYKI